MLLSHTSLNSTHLLVLDELTQDIDVNSQVRLLYNFVDNIYHTSQLRYVNGIARFTSNNSENR